MNRKMQDEFDKLVLAYEREIKKAYGIKLKELKAELALLYEKYSTNGILTLEDMKKYNRIDKFELLSKEVLVGLYAINKTVTNSALRDTFKTTVTSVQRVVSSSITFSLDPIIKKLDIDEVINAEMQGLHWADRLNKHRNDVIYSVNKTIREGLYNGETYASMAERLNKALYNPDFKTGTLGGDVFNAVTIVRTETGRVQSQTQKDILDPISDRVEMTKTWISSRDERVRSSHRSLNNTEILYRDNFTSPLGSTGFGPRLLEGPNSAADNINCRCWIDINFKERA